MRLTDYFRLGWDQLRRRKVVTALCVAGIAIGAASIIVALSFGKSISHYSMQQMSLYFKTHEIEVFPGRVEADEPAEIGQITPQKIELIRSLPTVEAVLPERELNYYDFTVDGSKRGSMLLIATDLTQMASFGYELQQGEFPEADDVIILNYGATLDLYDERLFQLMESAPEQMSIYADESFSEQVIPYPMYQKMIVLEPEMMPGFADGARSEAQPVPVRVAGILQKNEHLPPERQRWPKQAYISMSLGEQILDRLGMDNEIKLKVKVKDSNDLEETEQLIQKLRLSTRNNMYQQEMMQQELTIVRFLFGGVGLFILTVASISIVVAMTMSTYQRRRQIGIMKVLGANLRQIRNMFLVESVLLGIIGGLVGIILSYWVIWAINMAVVNWSGSGDEVLFIRFWVLAVGFSMASLTGMLSGIYPAAKASRTDALTAIHRE